MATIGLRGSLVRPLVTALRRALVESSGFSPLSLFAKGEQGAWYDPSDLSTLFQDSAGTVPVVASGDPVGLMLDKSGNGNHASQSVSASRPIYRTDGVLHWLEFDGVDDALVTSQIVTARSYFGAATITNNNQVVFAYNLAAAQYPSGVTGGLLYCLVGGSASFWTATPITFPRTFVQSAFIGTGINKGWLDSQPFATPATSAFSELTASHTIGVRGFASTPSWFLTGKVFGVVFTNSEVVLSEDRINVEQYLAQKSGVTLA